MTDSDNRRDLLAQLQEHAKKVDEVKQYCTDEANTRGALVEPLLKILGYDCTDPREVAREFTADVADRKGEKVDYALMRDGDPVVLVEAKKMGNRLGGSERQQLQRYFPFTSARLAILTDGIRWHWYRGRSDPGQSHQMESSAFLKFDAREPSEASAEWLTKVTKDGFNPDALLRIARRIELTLRVREWIDRTLVSPNLDDVSRFNAAVGLGASEFEVPLLFESIKSAWAQYTGDHVGESDQVAHSDAEAIPEEPASDFDHLDEPIQSIEQTTSQSPMTLGFKSHWDERLDLGNGKVLDANRLPRAWRVGDGDWIEEKNGTPTTNSALGELLRCDQRRNDEKQLAENLGLSFSVDKPQNRKLRRIPGFHNIYWNMDRNNRWKARMLEQIATNLQFSPPPDSPLASTPKIEWWLPEKPKR